MVIQHNLAAMNSHRVMGVNNANTSKNLEKLSSGYKINRAGDDAAGLAISEKMRGQINGLAMAEQNTANGISLIQTAEGGLNETHAILQRMRTLAVQSANGTYDSDVDRKNLDAEFQQIKDEIDRIAESTHYNGIKLLNGNLGATNKAGTAAVAAPEEITLNKASDIGVVGGAELYKADGTDIFGTGVTSLALTITNNQDGTFTVSDASGKFVDATIKAGDTSVSLLGASDTRDFIKLNLSDDAIRQLGQIDAAELKVADNGVITIGTATNITRDVSASHSALNAIGLSNTIAFNGTGSVTMPAGTYAISFAKQSDNSIIATMGNVTTRIEASTIEGWKTTGTGSFDVGDFKLTVDNVDAFTLFDKMQISGITTVRTDFTADVNDEAAYVIDHQNITVGGGNGLVFQIGANGGDDQRVKLYVDDMSSTSIGLKRGDKKSDGTIASTNMSLREASIASIAGANDAIDIITAATNMVSAQRANLGALQNRLEHTQNNLGVTKENLTAAESSIRDVDMAKEMMEFTKNNILVQASQAMLAQANQLPQGVLSLLR